MRIGSSILRSALLLTAVNLAMRGVSMLFQIWLAGAVGAAGLGLLQLILTVHGFAITVGTSGIRVAAMYLTAEEYGHRRYFGIKQAITLCILCGLCISTVTGFLLTFFSPQIADLWIRDPRAIPSLRLLGLTLPLTCLSAILSGYFTACNQIKRLVIVELCDKFATVGITALLLTIGNSADVEHACLAIVGGNAIANAGCLAALIIMMLCNFRNTDSGATTLPMGKRLRSLCVPLAMNDYLRSGLNTLEQFLIPSGLTKAGHSHEGALASYGTIQGMVFPVMMFPSTVLFAVSDLLVPELARCRAEKNQQRTDRLIGTCLKAGTLYATIIAGLLFVLAEPLCQKIYGSSEAGTYLKIFSPMVLMLYMDCIVDGMHKGLGQQVYCVKVNTLTSLLDVLFLFILLPRYGITGYLISFLATHALNFYLSIQKLLTLSSAAPKLRFLLSTFFSIFCAVLIADLLPHQSWGQIFVCAGVYLSTSALLLTITGAKT